MFDIQLIIWAGLLRDGNLNNGTRDPRTVLLDMCVDSTLDIPDNKVTAVNNKEKLGSSGVKKLRDTFTYIANKRLGGRRSTSKSTTANNSLLNDAPVLGKRARKKPKHFIARGLNSIQQSKPQK